MKTSSHSLKSACGYVGAGKLHYACYYLIKKFNEDDFQGMADYYPLVVEACIEFKRFSRNYLAEYNKAKYIETESAKTTELPSCFRLALH